MNSKNTHALIYWSNEKKYSILKMGDVFLSDDDDELVLEESYKVKQGLNVYEGIVKFTGNKEQCDKNLKQITTYKQTPPEKKDYQKTKPNTKVSKNDSSIKVSESKVNLLKKQKNESSSQKTQTKSSTRNNQNSETGIEIHKSKSSQGNNQNSMSSTMLDSDHNQNSETDDENTEGSNPENERKLKERDTLISSLQKQTEEQNTAIIQLKEEVEIYKAFSNPEFLKNFVPRCVQVMKYVASDSERDEVRQFGRVSDEMLIHVKYPGKYMSKNLFDRVCSMISEKKSSTSIFRTMATSLVPDVTIWGANNGSYMRDTYSELCAAKGNIYKINV